MVSRKHFFFIEKHRKKINNFLLNKIRENIILKCILTKQILEVFFYDLGKEAGNNMTISLVTFYFFLQPTIMLFLI